MARIRSIKPEFPQSESMGRVSRDARLLFVMLWTICDDHGRARAHSRMLASLLFPYDEDAGEGVKNWLQELSNEGCIRLYEVNGSQYLQITGWAKHQKIDRPSKPQFPDPDDDYREDSRGFVEGSINTRVGREGKGEEGKGEEQNLSSSGDDPKARGLEERVAEITRDAIGTWNESALVTECGLASVRASVGFDKRKAQVRRMLRTAREICQEQFGSTTVTRQFWVGLWKLFAKDDFFAGRVQGGRGHENWRPDFEFLTQEKNVLKLYDRVAPATEARA